MTASPARRPTRLRNLGVRQLAERFAAEAAGIELGWTLALEDRREAGWPSRTPDDDRRPRTGPPDTDPDALDYADPTGEMAIRLERLDGDIHAMQDHLLLIARSVAALRIIAGHHRPPSAPAVPLCSVHDCDQAVEHTGSGKGYVGCEQIGGVWVAKPGVVPVCRRHRTRRERAHKRTASSPQVVDDETTIV